MNKVYDALTLRELPGTADPLLYLLARQTVVVARWSADCDEWLFVDSEIANREPNQVLVTTLGGEP
jgi:hypothetical protein